MLAPEVVEGLQQHHLLDLAEVVFTELGGFARRLLVHFGEDALGDLLVGDAFLGGPLVDRQVEVEDAVDGLAQRLGVPLLGIGRSGMCVRTSSSTS